jgi:pantoate--beta-alanine ligase
VCKDTHLKWYYCLRNVKYSKVQVFQTVRDIQNYLLKIKSLENKSVGFVPTMGALHAGHISLIEHCKTLADLTVCSIFVNPTQFNDKSDFDKYPMQLDKDLEMLLDSGCDVVFVPDVEEIYPTGTLEKTTVDLGFIGKTLDAEHRPGHFEGVLQVVKRLLDIVQPDILVMGQKDYQQCMVIARLIEHYTLPVRLEICATMRETDGLAMSSRNMRLSQQERKSAQKLSQALFYIRDHCDAAPLSELIQQQLDELVADPLIQPEYLVAVHGSTLEPLTDYKEGIPLTLLIAAKVGNVRLIDNVQVK